MSAKIIPFPVPATGKTDPLDLLAARLANSIVELPAEGSSADYLKLLRRIDRKLTRLEKVILKGGAQ